MNTRVEIMPEANTLTQIKSVINDIRALQGMSENCTIGLDVDAAIKGLKKKEFELKEKSVLNVHQPKISMIEIPKDGKTVIRWQTTCGDKRPRCSTYEALIEKLFAYYFGEEFKEARDYTFKCIFDAALTEKKNTVNSSPNTIRKISADFNRYISATLANTAITDLTETDIMRYIQEWVNRVHPKKKAFLAFKGVLNLVFGYAFRHRIIPNNPLVFVKNQPYMKSCDTRNAKPFEKILSVNEIDMLKAEVRRRMGMRKYGDYYINGYAVLFSIETGVRVGELCAIKWEDISDDAIHIQLQQLSNVAEGGKEYFLVNYTKNEKGVSADGRYFPLTKKIKALLKEIKVKQEGLGIKSEFIFCHEDGDWIKTDAYETFLRRICRSLGFKVTNNHALRMSLNSNVLIPKGISAADRAAMLGHSIETNLKYYSYAQLEYISNVRDLLDGDEEGGTQGYLDNIVRFPKKESPEILNNQAF